MKFSQTSGATRSVLAGLVLLATAGLAGCRSGVNGQSTPSSYLQKDGVQYLPNDAETKFSNESAAMSAYRKNQGMQPMGQQAATTGQACNGTSCSCGAH